MRTFFRRLATIPFESLFGAIAVYAGIAGLFHIGTATDALDVILGNTIVTGLQVLYLGSGILILLGLGKAKAALEMPGLTLLVASVLIRAIAIQVLVGFTNDTAGVFVLDALVIVASCVRLAHLWKGWVVVLIKPGGDAD